MRVVKKPEQRRAELLATAKALFLEASYENTTVNDIVRHSGVAKGTFYHYFNTKEEVLDAVVEQMASCHLAQQLEQMTDAMTALEKIAKLFFNRTDHAPDSTHQAIHKQGNLLLHTKLLLAITRQYTPVLTEVIHQGNEEGIFAVHHPEETAELLLCGLQLMLDTDSGMWQPQDITRRMAALPTLLESSLRAQTGTFNALLATHN